MEWFPPWPENILEDKGLQDRSAQRLVEYMRDGRFFMNGRHLKVLTAEAVHSAKVKEEGALGIRFSFELQVTVQA